MSNIADEFVEAWNQAAMVNGWIPCRKMNAARANQLRLRLADKWWSENWREALEKAGPIPGLRGANDRGWKASVDWFLRPGTVVKIMEGVYDAWKPKTTGPVQPKLEDSAKQLAEMRAHAAKVKAEWAADPEGMKEKWEALKQGFRL